MTLEQLIALLQQLFQQQGVAQGAYAGQQAQGNRDMARGFGNPSAFRTPQDPAISFQPSTPVPMPPVSYPVEPAQNPFKMGPVGTPNTRAMNMGGGMGIPNMPPQQSQGIEAMMQATQGQVPSWNKAYPGTPQTRR